jgi:hypothetical protein
MSTDERVEREPTFYAVIPANVRYDRKLAPNAKLVYGEITALSSKHGFCWASNAYFARLYGVSKEQASRWISQLRDAGHIKVSIARDKKTKEIIERRLSLINPELTSFVSIGGIDNIKTPIDKMIKENSTRDNNTRSNNNYLSDSDFERFWKAVPTGRKIGKRKCRITLNNLIKKGDVESVDGVIEAMDKYRRYCELEHREVKHIKHPLTWLNHGCWDDEYDIPIPEEEEKEQLDIVEYTVDGETKVTF